MQETTQTKEIEIFILAIKEKWLWTRETKLAMAVARNSGRMSAG